jgi:hypothetical protein
MFSVLIVSSVIVLTQSQTNGGLSLFVVENVYADDGIAHTRRLVRVHLDRSGDLTKEAIVTTDQEFFGHFGRHRLVGNRHLVTQYGGIVDIAARRVVHAEFNGELLGCEAGKVVYRVDNAYRDSGIFTFDLQTCNLEKLMEPAHWRLPGEKSPNRTMSVKPDFDGTLVLYKIDGTKKVLVRGFGVNFSKLASWGSQDVPCLWLDNDRILTQRANGHLEVLNTLGISTTVAHIDNAPPVLTPPDLRFDKAGRIIYSCGSAEFLVDVAGKSASPLSRYALGHGFEASVELDRQNRHSIYFENEFVGQWVLNPYQAYTAPGLIGFAYVEPGGNLGYPKGIAVWRADHKVWRTIDSTANDVVGWAR